jgi:hypothetical protein
MTKTDGTSPAAVPARAIRAGETQEASLPHQEWSWVEPRIWTERMLAALGQGVTGGKMPSLPSTGFSACTKPMSWPASPLAGKTINRRAGCGRSARPVRREGGANPIASPYPYHCSAAPNFQAVAVPCQS